MSETPILDRVEIYMRDAKGQVEQADVVRAFSDQPPKLVRLCLQALRKNGTLEHCIEDNKMYYMWMGAKVPRPPDAPPLRKNEHRIRAISPTKEKIVEAMRTGNAVQYSFSELRGATGLTEDNLRHHLQELVRSSGIFASGRTASRRYSLEQQPEPAARRPIPVYEAPAKTSPELAGDEAAAPPLDAADFPIIVTGSTEPIAAITADRRLVVVNGGRGITFDREITGAIIECIRRFDELLSKPRADLINEGAPVW